MLYYFELKKKYYIGVLKKTSNNKKEISPLPDLGEKDLGKYDCKEISKDDYGKIKKIAIDIFNGKEIDNLYKIKTQSGDIIFTDENFASEGKHSVSRIENSDYKEFMYNKLLYHIKKKTYEKVDKKKTLQSKGNVAGKYLEKINIEKLELEKKHFVIKKGTVSKKFIDEVFKISKKEPKVKPFGKKNFIKDINKRIDELENSFSYDKMKDKNMEELKKYKENYDNIYLSISNDLLRANKEKNITKDEHKKLYNNLSACDEKVGKDFDALILLLKDKKRIDNLKKYYTNNDNLEGKSLDNIYKGIGEKASKIIMNHSKLTENEESLGDLTKYYDKFLSEINDFFKKINDKREIKQQELLLKKARLDKIKAINLDIENLKRDFIEFNVNNFKDIKNLEEDFSDLLKEIPKSEEKKKVKKVEKKEKDDDFDAAKVSDNFKYEAVDDELVSIFKKKSFFDIDSDDDSDDELKKKGRKISSKKIFFNKPSISFDSNEEKNEIGKFNFAKRAFYTKTYKKKPSITVDTPFEDLIGKSDKRVKRLNKKSRDLNKELNREKYKKLDARIVTKQDLHNLKDSEKEFQLRGKYIKVGKKKEHDENKYLEYENVSFDTNKKQMSRGKGKSKQAFATFSKTKTNKTKAVFNNGVDNDADIAVVLDSFRNIAEGKTLLIDCGIDRPQDGVKLFLACRLYGLKAKFKGNGLKSMKEHKLLDKLNNLPADHKTLSACFKKLKDAKDPQDIDNILSKAQQGITVSGTKSDNKPNNKSKKQ